MFKPVNRYILIELLSGDLENAPLIVLPEDYKAPQEKYAIAVVLNAAADIRFDLKSSSHIVVDRSMIEELVINKTTYSVIQDNYVVGIII